jgi:hypothetical protein
MAQIARNWQTSLAKPRTLSASMNSKPLPIVGYFNSDEILACGKAGITVTLPNPMTSNAKRPRGALRQAGLPLLG